MKIALVEQTEGHCVESFSITIFSTVKQILFRLGIAAVAARPLWE